VKYNIFILYSGTSAPHLFFYFKPKKKLYIKMAGHYVIAGKQVPNHKVKRLTIKGARKSFDKSYSIEILP
jgi:hypothetical protein